MGKGLKTRGITLRLSIDNFSVIKTVQTSCIPTNALSRVAKGLEH